MNRIHNASKGFGLFDLGRIEKIILCLVAGDFFQIPDQEDSGTGKRPALRTQDLLNNLYAFLADRTTPRLLKTLAGYGTLGIDELGSSELKA
jgi:hypothetical protein